MATFECSGLMNPKKFVDENINKNDFKKDDFNMNFKHNNFILNGLSDPLNFVQKMKNNKELIIEKNNNNNNIDDKEKQLCESVARNIKENTRWFDKKRSYEESLGSHCF